MLRLQQQASRHYLEVCGTLNGIVVHGFARRRGHRPRRPRCLGQPTALPTGRPPRSRLRAYGLAFVSGRVPALGRYYSRTDRGAHVGGANSKPPLFNAEPTVDRDCVELPADDDADVPSSALQLCRRRRPMPTGQPTAAPPSYAHRDPVVRGPHGHRLCLGLAPRPRRRGKHRLHRLLAVTCPAADRGAMGPNDSTAELRAQRPTAAPCGPTTPPPSYVPSSAPTAAPWDPPTPPPSYAIERPDRGADWLQGRRTSRPSSSALRPTSALRSKRPTDGEETAAPSALTRVPTTARASYAPSKLPIPWPSTRPSPARARCPRRHQSRHRRRPRRRATTWVPTAGPPTQAVDKPTRWPTWPRPTYQPTKSEAPTYAWVPTWTANLKPRARPRPRQRSRRRAYSADAADAAAIAVPSIPTGSPRLCRARQFRAPTTGPTIEPISKPTAVRRKRRRWDTAA